MSLTKVKGKVLPLESKLNNIDGATNIGVTLDGAASSSTVSDVINGKYGYYSTVSQLRSLNPTVNGQVFLVQSHTSSNIGGGEFYYDSTDTTSTDDNGWTIVTSTNKRIKRKNISSIKLEDFGLLPNGSIDLPLQNAIKVSSKYSISNIYFPSGFTGCTLTGGLSINIPSCDINLIADGAGYQSFTLSHTGNNTGITFVRGNLFNRAKIEGIWVTGNAGTSASFVQFRDSWRCTVERCRFSGYTTSAPMKLLNDKGWTEDFNINDVMIRGCLRGVIVERNSANGGTNSLMGMKWRDFWFQHGIGNSRVMALANDVDPDGFLLYNAELEFGGWFEAGGGHRGIVIGNNCKFIDSYVKTKYDGFGGLIDGSDMYVLQQSGTGIIDVTCIMMNQQGTYANVSSTATGSTLNGFKHSLASNNNSLAVNGRSCTRAKGAKFRWELSGTDDKKFIIAGLPEYSSFNVILWAKGNNVELCKTFRVDMCGHNNVAKITSITNNTVQDTNFKIQVFNNLTGGAFSAGDGGKFEWIHNAATMNDGIFSATLEIEML